MGAEEGHCFLGVAQHQLGFGELGGHMAVWTSLTMHPGGLTGARFAERGDSEKGVTPSVRSHHPKIEARRRRASRVDTDFGLVAGATAPFGSAASPDGGRHQAAPLVARLLIPLVSLRRLQHAVLVQLTLKAPERAIYRLVITYFNRQYSPPLSGRAVKRGSMTHQTTVEGTESPGEYQLAKDSRPRSLHAHVGPKPLTSLFHARPGLTQSVIIPMPVRIVKSGGKGVVSQSRTSPGECRCAASPG